jgi:hypothetical protein
MYFFRIGYQDVNIYKAAELNRIIPSTPKNMILG